MVKFRSEILSDNVTRIHGTAGEQMYLVEGKKRAALIDTGTGVGDLKKYITALTKMPITVLVTHGHGDHALGAPQFDEIYLSYLDENAYYARCKPELRKEFLKLYAIFEEIDESDYIPIPPLQVFNDLKDGAVFDLGGITLEAISCGGHSPGCMMILIREEKTLITGDACNYFTMLQGDTCTGLSTYERNLIAANERTKGRYNRVYLSHGNVTAPVTLIDEVLEVCEEIKKGKDDKIPFGHLDTNGLVAKAYGKNAVSSYARMDGKCGNIVYNPNRIWE